MSGPLAGKGLRWRTVRVGRPAPVGHAHRHWVVASRSLTAAMRRHWPQSFAVQVLFEGWATAAAEEARRLGLPARRRVWVREVALLGGGRVRILARSVIPAASRVAVRGLGSQPLGDRLFLGAGSEREPLEVAPVRRRHWLSRHFQAVQPEAADARWARRAVHRLQGRPLLVTELFLPDLPVRRPNGEEPR